MIILETERLRLRTWKEGDKQALITISQDPEVMQHFPSIPSNDDVKNLFDKINQHQKDKGYSLYAVELKSTADFIGFVGLLTVGYQAHFTPAVEIGWRIAKAYWNKGYATEAAKAVLKKAFFDFKLHEIVSFTTTTNLASQRVMQKIGLHHSTHDDFDHPRIDKNNPLCRHVLYRLSKKDYLASLEN